MVIIESVFTDRKLFIFVNSVIVEPLKKWSHVKFVVLAVRSDSCALLRKHMDLTMLLLHQSYAAMTMLSRDKPGLCVPLKRQRTCSEQ